MRSRLPKQSPVWQAAKHVEQTLHFLANPGVKKKSSAKTRVCAPAPPIRRRISPLALSLSPLSRQHAPSTCSRTLQKANLVRAPNAQAHCTAAGDSPAQQARRSHQIHSLPLHGRQSPKFWAQGGEGQSRVVRLRQRRAAKPATLRLPRGTAERITPYVTAQLRNLPCSPCGRPTLPKRR